MANHTAEPTRRSVLTRRVTILGVSVPVLVPAILALGATAALAAILLTTNITGKATIVSVSTSNAMDVSATSADGSALKCNVAVNDTNTQLSINPELTKQVGGGNASGVPIPGGACTLTVKVHNTGDTTIKVASTSRRPSPSRTGWAVTDITGLDQPIAKGATGTLTAKITANQDATAGDFGGKLVYTDGA
jgi:hypothetical protein